MQSLMLATDLSPAAEPALRRAADLARRYACPWYILHVLEGDAADAEKQAAARLERRMELLTRLAGRAPEVWIERGDVVDQITASTRWAEVDLLVLGGGPLNRYLRDLPCELLIVPPALERA
ncbi:universal stress protein [Pseudomonas sp. UL073]|uniref:Universal stress protein n=1 Tax=Zestomonas insulae TaxID=2809017 RepID=A0ABS2IF04_9GAMM|nr:universal stress protein [Pseudomonas insulae]MBM7061674.1 universal stress protein [Pseudomonas insulae]